MYPYDNETVIQIKELQRINLCAKELLNLIPEIIKQNDKDCQKAVIEACEFYALKIIEKTTRNN